MWVLLGLVATLIVLAIPLIYRLKRSADRRMAQAYQRARHDTSDPREPRSSRITQPGLNRPAGYRPSTTRTTPRRRTVDTLDAYVNPNPFDLAPSVPSVPHDDGFTGSGGSFGGGGASSAWEPSTPDASAVSAPSDSSSASDSGGGSSD